MRSHFEVVGLGLKYIFVGEHSSTHNSDHRRKAKNQHRRRGGKHRVWSLGKYSWENKSEDCPQRVCLWSVSWFLLCFSPAILYMLCILDQSHQRHWIAPSHSWQYSRENTLLGTKGTKWTLHSVSVFSSVEREYPPYLLIICGIVNFASGKPYKLSKEFNHMKVSHKLIAA